MASAVVNSTGDIFFSKVTESTASPANNVLITTSTVAGAPAAAGAWENDLVGALAELYTANASEAGPVKGTVLLKIPVTTFTTGSVAKGYVSGSGISLANYDAVTFYLRIADATAATIAAGALKLKMWSGADWSTGLLEDLSLPAIPVCLDTFTDTAADVDKWVRVVLKLNTPSTDSVKSIALNVETSGVLDSKDVYIHEFRLLKSFPGRTNFSISETVDTIDVSDYQSLTAKEFASTYSTWTVSMDGHKEGAPPIDKGKEYVLGIWESDTVGQCFVGNAFYTTFTPSGSFTETIKYNYTFQGTGALSRPLA